MYVKRKKRNNERENGPLTHLTSRETNESLTFARSGFVIDRRRRRRRSKARARRLAS